MDAMRIQQELLAKRLEQPRRAADFEESYRSREGLGFLARSLGWELRLDQLRAQPDGTGNAPVIADRKASAA